MAGISGSFDEPAFARNTDHGSASNYRSCKQALALSVYDNMDWMEKQLLKTILLIRSRVGVLSLTERFDSLPMWAHYGALAQGYVVRFDGLDENFSGDTTGSLNILKPVKYVEDLVGLTHDPSTQDDLFCCKFRDWNYEREWRVVSALSACQFNADSNMYLRSINPAIVTAVICGWNVSEAEAQALAIELHRINPRLELYPTALKCGRVSQQKVLFKAA
jgi:hypothetical protein